MTPTLQHYRRRDHLLAVGATPNLSDDLYDGAIADAARKLERKIVETPITCPADLAAQFLVQTDHGGFQLASAMIAKLRGLAAGAGRAELAELRATPGGATPVDSVVELAECLLTSTVPGLGSGREVPKYMIARLEAVIDRVTA